ncbi:MAG: IS701 family transposase [candidate division KSB1 bacterium]|nr:IS701 family transposase [candidate division KSB1 bacterium]
MGNKHAQRISHATPPPSGRQPKLNVASRQIDGLRTQLEKYHQIFAPLFQRQEQRQWSLKYMEGQMLDLERKSIEPMARALEGGNVQAMQQFTSASGWNDDVIIRAHQREVGKTLGQKDGVIIADGSDFPKQGENSVGVARQYCGALGKTANCQAAVFLAYASDRGHTLLDRRLYMPQHWFSSEYDARREECEVPETLSFQTKNELVWSMLEPLLDDESLPFELIMADEALGHDNKLLNKIAAKNKTYFVEIPCDTPVLWRQPKMFVPKGQSGRRGRHATKARLAADASAPKCVDDLAKALKKKYWRRVIVHEGSKGPQEVEIAVLYVVFTLKGLPVRKEWLIVRRKSSRQPLAKWKFFRSNAPKKTSWKKLARWTAWRWPIETTIEECKGDLGMDHYEVRNWRGWHHHMTMTMLSHHFLVRIRVEMGDDAPALTVSQARQLLKVILPKRELDAQALLQEIQRTQQQNYNAYRSHRKRRRRQKAALST